MQELNLVRDLADEIVAWRHEFHAHPELMYDVHRTAGRVAELLRGFGFDEVASGIGRTGVVGIVHGNRPGRMIGLRADMDALPMDEATGLPYASTIPGRMHACGMTAIRRCCWAPRNAWPKHETSPARSR